MDENRRKIIDADLLFDNFDEFCEVQFKAKCQSTKAPSVVKNLSRIFNRVANPKPSSVGDTHSRPGTRSKSKPKSKSSKRDEWSKNETKDMHSVKQRLKMNLKNVFGSSKDSMPCTGKFRSAKNMNRNASNAQTVLLSFMQAKGDDIRGAHLNPVPRKRSESPSRSKSKGTKNTKKKVLMLNNIFNERDLFVRRILEEKSRRSGLMDKNGPVTGSTRVHTASRLESTKRTHASLLETDNKSKSISLAKPKSRSKPRNPDTSNTVNTCEKPQPHPYLKDSHRDNAFRKVSRKLFLQAEMPADPSKINKKSASGSRIRNQAKELQHSREKYFLPGKVAFKGHERAQKHSSLVLSEEQSVGSAQHHKLLASMMLPIMNRLKVERDLRPSRGFLHSKTTSATNTLKSKTLHS